MKRGQGSLEYLLILAAILAIAVVVVLVANAMLGQPSEAAAIQQDKYNLAIQGFEIKGYDKPIDVSNPGTMPILNKGGQDFIFNNSAKPIGSTKVGDITDSSGTKHGVYVGGGGGGGGGSYYVDPPITGPTATPVTTPTPTPGPCSTDCDNGEDCTSYLNCSSGFCTSGECAACTGDEDCEGSMECTDGVCTAACSPDCINGEDCGTYADCTSLYCNFSKLCDACVLDSACRPGYNCTSGNCTLCSPDCPDGALCSDDEDCASTNCSDDLVCSPKTEVGVEDCDDVIDNDGDGYADCEDPDCAEDPACEVVVEVCDNDIDDDSDGDFDCDDSDCDADPACTGGGVETFVSGAGRPFRLAVDDTYVYWGNKDGRVDRARKSDGAYTALCTYSSYLPGAVGGVAVDSSLVYWGQYYQTTAKWAYANKADCSSPSGGTFAGTSQYVTGIDVSGTKVYWLSSGYGIRKFDFATYTVTDFYLDNIGENDLEVASNGYVYFTDPSAIWNKSVSGGLAQVWKGSLPDPTGIDTDNTYIYWVDDSDNAVYRAPISDSNAVDTLYQYSGGSNPEMFGVAVDSTHVYWGEHYPGVTSYIKRVALPS